MVRVLVNFFKWRVLVLFGSFKKEGSFGSGSVLFPSLLQVPTPIVCHHLAAESFSVSECDLGYNPGPTS